VFAGKPRQHDEVDQRGLVNVFEPVLDREVSQPGFVTRFARLSEVLDGELLGASIYEISPGERGMPFHAHHANEELMLALTGTTNVVRLKARLSWKRERCSCLRAAAEALIR
jgi:uncharacterized cupin superfamily protein